MKDKNTTISVHECADIFVFSYNGMCYIHEYIQVCISSGITIQIIISMNMIIGIRRRINVNCWC